MAKHNAPEKAPDLGWSEPQVPANAPDATGLSPFTSDLMPPEKADRDPAKRVLKEGDKVFMRAVYGRTIHPYQVPVEFNQEAATRVVVDGWVITQYEAGKLAVADDE